MKLKTLEKQFKDKESLAIFTHNNPDPDCLSSAYTLSLIARNFGVKPKIIYSGDIGRSENREMVKLLGLRIFHIDELEHDEINNFSIYAIVDSQKGFGNNLFPEDIVPDITFDHHETNIRTKKGKQVFTEISPTSGATSTIVLRYYLKLGLEITPTLATAYCYAVMSETKDMDRGATSKDIWYFNKLYKYANQKILSKIRYAKKPINYINTLKTALNKYKIENGIATCVIGKVHSTDYIAEIADLLLGVEEVFFSIVIGEYKLNNNGDEKDPEYFASVRTSLDDVNMGKLLGGVIRGKGKAGGHDQVAAGQFSNAPAEIIDGFTKATKKYLPLPGETSASSN